MSKTEGNALPIGARPALRMAYLLLAVFFMFGTIGFLTSILSFGKMPSPGVGFGWAFFSGGTAICYVLVFARKPVLLPVLVLSQLLLNAGYSALTGRIMAHGWLRPSPEQVSTTVFALAATTYVVLGYAFFLIFIQTQGKQTIRAQAELAMAHSIQQTLVPRLDLTAAGCRIFGVSVPSDKVGGDVVTLWFCLMAE